MKKKQYLCSMKKKIIRILIWFGFLFGCTVITTMLAMLLFNGNDSVYALKWIQILSVIGMFMAPPLICAYLWDEDHRPDQWLKMDRGTHWSHFVLACIIMIVAQPAINLLAYLNGMIPMPDSMIEAEETANKTIEAFLDADNAGTILFNFFLLALLPAIAEEMTFRGTMQQILEGQEEKEKSRKIHLAIWITAITFSAIHMQFMGFIPRMLMGALFGYMFYWTGTLWIPIAMHFTNNAIGIALYYIVPSYALSESNSADTMGVDTMWIGGLISLLITCLGLLIFYRRTHKQ